MFRRIFSLVTLTFDKLIVKKKQESNFWILYTFLMTFTVSRLFVYIFPTIWFSTRGVHIHHFAYGFLLLAFSGIAAINSWPRKNARIIAVMYGIGLGLSTDEFAMWIRLDDDYWIRHSYDAVVFVGVLLFSIVYFSAFWRKILQIILLVHHKSRRIIKNKL
ncbi:hypothetical protein HGB07_01575 [Candidatus Roizmanbacteria bacterium]|nr:hypothetical protein [Candidatus Roizmanbacteria bacterium]